MLERAAAVDLGVTEVELQELRRFFAARLALVKLTTRQKESGLMAGLKHCRPVDLGVTEVELQELRRFFAARGAGLTWVFCAAGGRLVWYASRTGRVERLGTLLDVRRIAGAARVGPA